MRNLFLTFAAALVLSACQPTGSTSIVPTAPPIFEIRDFKFDQANENGIVMIRGRGTLVTRDSRLLSGTYMVWISVKKEHRKDREQRYAVVLKDGVGNIETTDRLDEFTAATVSTQFKDWRIVGYTNLEPGQLAASISSASSPKP